MTASELINTLQHLIIVHGDLDVRYDEDCLTEIYTVKIINDNIVLSE